MSKSPRRSLLKYLLTGMVLAAGLVGYENKETGEVQVGLTPSPVYLSIMQPTVIQTVTPTATATLSPTPTLFAPGPLFDADLDLWAGPVDVPLELQIPSLNIDVPVIGVGLTEWNVMDAPTSSVGSPFWHSAFWYRGGGIPGEVGTATFAGHITDPLGKPGAFRYLREIHTGALIIVRDQRTSIDMLFIVDEVEVISQKESTDPAVLTRIFGAGPVAGTGPQPSLDGLAHLTLITCATNFITGNFDDRTIVYATRIK
ncbi:MAG: hypothetical protein A2X25_15400 [Chloroflexi bacterium GWB2_49_20]|nr:MAG: hypothetical protein A2X25_15400 [Chloroflexi bacterium GWB2_49_20]OGN77453.1 MAG: hypothetical protein A2X26_13630 [Chloroflexi bacterium GWC2_49_37]OGN84843.1 MAG: hypothetical protein A2X27_14820 [Chloroflexi bacterium GWD2_49_16]HCC79233.1 hypothetical protein [Anaerolineae bacterium]